MADFKPKPGSFLPFLEYMEKEKGAPQTALTSPATVLEILSRQTAQSLPVFDLQTLTGMDPGRFREVLKVLRDAEFVMIEGDSLDGVVRLTSRGAEAARLARPA